jgi:ATP-dependent Lon protease
MAEKKQKNYLEDIKQKVEKADLPAGLTEKADQEIRRLELIQHGDAFWRGLDQLSHWTDWIISLPWNKKTKDILDLGHAQKILDESHYGLEEIKDRILEYLAVLILKQKRREGRVRAPILCFVGLVGTGKTTIAKSIAEALDRKFIRIPFGGLGDPLYLRGQSRIHPEAEPGHVIKGLRQVKAKNPVILLDEIDRVADDSLNTIMGVLVELLDPEQNDRFSDYFIDYPFDLSEAIFIATANHTRRIATAVMDRLEVLQMPSYTDDEKIAIGKDYLLPKAIKQTGLNSEEITFEERVWPKITRPLGYDAGVRTLYRNIESICRKAARQIIEGKKEKIQITVENVNDYLPL